MITPSVSVPVLSVKSTSMLPRSSIATRRLTRTRLAASARDPDERLTVTMAGIISGAMPTAMASEKRSASISGRDRMTFAAKTNVVRTAATMKRKRENRDSPSSKALRPMLSATPVAIRPNAVRVPVRTTTAVAEPSWTMVPM